MDNRKLIAFDSDDTLVYHANHGSFIRDSSIEALRLLKEDGHIVALATGRPAMFSRDVMVATGIDNGVFVNGNSIVAAGREIAGYHLNTEEMPYARRWVSEERIEVFAFDRDQMYFSDLRGEPIGRRDKNFLSLRERVLDNVRPLSDDSATYAAVARDFAQAPSEVRFLMVRASDEQLDRLRPHLVALELTSWSQGLWELRNHGTNKLSGVLELAAHFGVDPADTVCFGDSFNDVEMLAGSGVGIAMGNAHDDVKKHADHITGSSDEDGIWDACRMLGLI